MRANGVSAFSPSQRSNCKAWPDASDSLALVLEMMGARIEVAYDGEGALAAADREVPQIALLDLGMPVMERAPLGEVRRHARGLLAAPGGGVADGELVQCGIAHRGLLLGCTPADDEREYAGECACEAGASVNDGHQIFRIGPGYVASSASPVTSVMPSLSACASSNRSNGSRWMSGSPSTPTAC